MWPVKKVSKEELKKLYPEGDAMPKLKVQFKKFSDKAQTPVKGSKGAAAYDMFATRVEHVNEMTGPLVIYGTSIGVKIPEGYVGIIAPRSSISTHTTLCLTNSIGVIDSDYVGEIIFKFRNTNSTFGKKYNVGDRIGQLMIVPVMELELVEVKELPQTERGEGGYGSTGK